MSKMRILRAVVGIAATFGVLASQALAQAQPYPNRPIRLVVPYGPGASTDATARLVAQKMAEDLKQPVVVDNRAGAGGMIGSEFVARSAPDGYTILLGTDGSHVGNPLMMKNHPFDPLRDVTPLTMAVKGVLVLVAHPATPFNNVRELIEHAKRNPGKLSFGSSGNGSPHHLAGEMFNQMTGTQMVHVPYKGGGPAVQDVVGGQIPLVYSTLVSVLPLIKSGKLKALGITEKTRFSAAPDIPTIAETVPGFEISAWLAFMGPAGLPEPIVKTLNQSLVKALKAPDVTAKLEEAGLLVVANSPEEFGAQLRATYASRGELIRKANIKID